jgi:epoxyqueuosine reductase
VNAVLDPASLQALEGVAQEHGLARLGAVALDHPGFSPARVALDEFLARGLAGEMAFLPRSAAIRREPARMLPEARSILVALVPYDGEPGPIARYAQHADYHTIVHRRLLRVERALLDRIPDARTLVCVDTKPILERTAAVLAGLGFLGKNGCLIAPGLGSYVLIGCILTTAQWTGANASTSNPPWDACGSCRACLDACPTQAFDSPGRLDPRRCISYLTIEHRGSIEDILADRFGDRIAGCDACQEACPYNRSSARTERVPAGSGLPAPPGPRRDVDLARLATLGNNQHRSFVRGTPLDRIPRRAFRRNALLALGNAAGPVGADERAAIERGLLDGDAQVRAAAERARRRRLDRGSD